MLCGIRLVQHDESYLRWGGAMPAPGKSQREARSTERLHERSHLHSMNCSRRRLMPRYSTNYWSCLTIQMPKWGLTKLAGKAPWVTNDSALHCMGVKTKEFYWNFIFAKISVKFSSETLEICEFFDKITVSLKQLEQRYKITCEKIK